MKNLKNKLLIIILGSSLLLTSCGTQETGTSGGNPAIVKIQSSAYTNDGTLALFMHPVYRKISSLFLIPSAYAGPVTDFQFCITKLKIVTDGEAAAGASQEAILGLVNVTNQSATVDWGNITLTEGASISEIHFEIHNDSQNCSGAAFSASYNGTTITQDLEFKFKFNPAVTVNEGDIFTLGISKIGKAFEDAYQAGQLDNANIGTYMQNVIGEGVE